MYIVGYEGSDRLDWGGAVAIGNNFGTKESFWLWSIRMIYQSQLNYITILFGLRGLKEEETNQDQWSILECNEQYLVRVQGGGGADPNKSILSLVYLQHITPLE